MWLCDACVVDARMMAWLMGGCGILLLQEFGLLSDGIGMGSGRCGCGCGELW